MFRSTLNIPILLLFISTACSPILADTKATPNAIGVVETRLPNGLKVLTKEVHAAPVVCTYVWYHVGSRNETPGLTGVSHQLEHMLFKGTKKLFPNPGYIDLLIGRHGGENNAETDTDHTAYYLLLPADQLDLALRIEADRMTSAAIDPKQLTSEKTVVLSELEGDENDNSYFLSENTRATAFQYHPYHYPVIGTKFDVKHFSREAVYSYYRAHYAPNNATLVIVGDFKTDKLIARIKELWKDVQPSAVPRLPLNPEPQQRGERRVQVRRAGATPYLQIEHHIPNAISKDMPALEVLSTALSGGRSSRLYKALVETQLATSISASANTGIDPELFDISATVRTGVEPDKVEQAILAELERVKSAPLNDRELQKAKNQARSDFIFAQDSVIAQASRLGYFDTIYGDWHALTTYLPKINAVTAKDVLRAAQLYFKPENRTVGTFIPVAESGKVEGASGTGRPANYKKSRAIPGGAACNSTPINTAISGGQQQASPVKLFVKKLPNGLKVIIRENHANPTVAIGGYIRAGSVSDPAGKFGLASLVAGMLTRGTTTKTSQQIAEEEDFVGAHVGAGASRERTAISAGMLSENFESITALFADTLLHPSFPEEELEKLRGETLTGIQEAENDTASVTMKRLYETLYAADNPFQHRPEGRADEIKSITKEDLQNFYRQAYRPDRTTLIIVGDVKSEQAYALIEKLFGEWHGEGDSLQEYKPAELPISASAPAPVVVTIPDKSQNDMAMGSIGMSRKAPDYEAARLMNLILGEDAFVGRVGKRVRDTEGLAYSAYTVFSPALETGPWLFRAGVNPSNVTKAIASAKDEIRKMAAKGVTDSELAWAKDNSIGRVGLSLATNSGMAAELETEDFYGLGLDYAARYPKIIRALTKLQVNAAAKKYLRPDALATVVVGPPVPGMSAQKK